MKRLFKKTSDCFFYLYSDNIVEIAILFQAGKNKAAERKRFFARIYFFIYELFEQD